VVDFLDPGKPPAHVLAMTPEERIDAAVLIARARPDEADVPVSSEQELAASAVDALEVSLGCPLPAEYRTFVQRHGWLYLGPGWQVAGLMPEDHRVDEHVPWVSDRHQPPRTHLVIGAYWRFADGDQLLIDLADPNGPVYVYLHEHGPFIDPLAPSFSLALYRLAADPLT
jgi:hypothetical protein